MITAKANLVHMNPDFNWLIPVFDQLTHIINNFIHWEEEPPYYYNETACVSLLTAAGARADCIVFSQYSAEKKEEHRTKDGFCDFYIRKPNASRHYLEIEAKQIWLRNVDPNVEEIKQGLDWALSDAKKLKWAKSHERAGLLFAVLSQSKDDAKQFDPKQFEETLKQVKADLCWWLWYDRSWEDTTFRWSENGRYYPGVAVFLRR